MTGAQATLLFSAIMSFVCAGAGAYFGSYFKKKGENLATKEDFDELKEQTRQLTHTTIEIEAKIGDQVWDRQRRWELKRDILLEATKRITEANDAVYAWASISLLINKQQRQDWSDDLPGAVERWVKAYDEYGTSVALVGIVCEEETITPLEQLALHLGDLNENIHGQDANAEHKLKKLDVLVKEAKAAIRHEVRK